MNIEHPDRLLLVEMNIFISKIHRITHANKKLIIVIFAVLYVAILLKYCGHVFIVNDDIAIEANIREGMPVKYIPYFSILFLNILYTNLSHVIPWYGSILYLIHVIGISVSIVSFTKIRQKKHFVFFMVLFYLLLYAPFIVRITYTSTSILIGGSSLFAFLTFWASGSSKRNSFVLLGVLLAISYLVRKNGAFAVIIFSAPILVFFSINQTKQNLNRLFLFLLPLVITMSFNTIIEKTLFSDDYLSYLEFDNVRYKIHETKIERMNIRNETILNANNWTSNDYFLFTQYIFPHEKKYSLKALQNILDLALPTGTIQSSFRNATIFIKKKHSNYLYLILILFLMSIRNLDFRKLCYSTIFIGFFMSGVYYFVMFERFPPRVSHPIYFMCILILTYLTFGLKNFVTDNDSNVLNKVIGIISTVLLVVVLYSAYNEFPLHRVDFKPINDFYDQNIEYIQKQYKGKLVIAQPGVMRNEFSNPLKVYRYEETIGMIPLGWETFSPRFYKKIHAAGIKEASGIWPKIIDNNNAYFFGNEDIVSYLLQFIEETYGVKCKAIGIEQLKLGPTVYQFQSIKPD